MDKKKNQEMKKEIDNIIDDIVNSDSKIERRDLLDKLMSLKSQYDIIPVIYDVPIESIVKEYDYGAVRIIRTKKFIIYQIKGGMGIIVSPRMVALYEYLDNMLNMKDNYDNLSNEEKDGYDLLYLGINTLFNLPCIAVVDDKFFSSMVLKSIEESKELYERLIKKPLQDETPIDDAKFENDMDMMYDSSNL